MQEEKSISNIANELIGIPYKHNGRTEEGLDCWGVVYMFFEKLGVVLPSGDGGEVPDDWYKKDPDRYHRDLKKLGHEIGHYNNLQPLDIPYFRLYKNVVTHTAVMLDQTHFLHVLNDKEVSIGTMNRRIWRRKYEGGRRLDDEVLVQVSSYVKDLTLKQE